MTWVPAREALLTRSSSEFNFSSDGRTVSRWEHLTYPSAIYCRIGAHMSAHLVGAASRPIPGDVKAMSATTVFVTWHTA